MAAPQGPPSGKPRNSTSQSPITTKTLATWAKAGRQHRYPYGGGLYFQTRRTSASWVFRFRFGGARRAMGLGAFPQVGLAAARDGAGRARLALLEGRDPISERKATAATRRKAPASDGGVGSVPRPMTMQEAVVAYGDPKDVKVWRNAEGDMGLRSGNPLI